MSETKDKDTVNSSALTYKQHHDRCCDIETVTRLTLSALQAALSLTLIPAPSVFEQNSGLNDDLNGEAPATVARPIYDVSNCSLLRHDQTTNPWTIQTSCAKYKRATLTKYDYPADTGIVIVMNAMRPHEPIVDHTHSPLLTQLDYELHAPEYKNNVLGLKIYIQRIYEDCLLPVYAKMKESRLANIAARPLSEKDSGLLVVTSDDIDTKKATASQPESIIAEDIIKLPEHIVFLETEELLQRYPTANTPEERELCACKEFIAVCIIGIGAPLSDGKPHGGRAPDYDNHSMNYDILLLSTYDTVERTSATVVPSGRREANTDNGNDGTGNKEGKETKKKDTTMVPIPDAKIVKRVRHYYALEISSGGCRVDANTLKAQLKRQGLSHRLELPFHQAVVRGEMVPSFGGGIGLDRWIMFVLGLQSIYEVQVGPISQEIKDKWYRERGIRCL